ncbi:hypothetical protein RMAECT_0686 [Rickettsia rhipicephali str. Ect]|uniref:Uncharacterized protein n=1 Tax=Rickettsia rhipicephali str. Ect TaxID=1359199 RepID=A0A0F3PCU4_RICRH|nr:MULTISPECIES: hypothetical protein [spotted fever group]KJV78113.1 hypothetical protein RMAECT_0686 [Rickettsia rhipicephali str. Ect]
MAVGVKDRENKLVIHADKIPAFNRTYWASWFGQKDSMVLPLENNIFEPTTDKKLSLIKIIIVRKPKFILISIINLNTAGA